jgi:hypothetical protein
MITLEFDDVIEYVRSGEDDPDMAALLARHPEGPALLKQARFIARVLQQKSEGRSDSGRIPRTILRRAASREPALPSKQAASEQWLRSIFRGAASTDAFTADVREPVGEGLGTLVISSDGDRVSLSYDSTGGAADELPHEKGFPDSREGDIEIRGLLTTLSLPASAAAGEAIRVRISDGPGDEPAGGGTLIFMPESGPFVRYEADGEGIVKMRVPDESGTLRIEAGSSETLAVLRNP